ncbi:nitrite reductase [Shewanella sp. UCD-KL12]|uniref:tetratricopeptide repeat protein n=1 Tax=Shewanella sp. UCD-KL12 TaxID=1917163 RepID=UPI0009706A9E|nr:nitrite reductase [Shewanella sp. UCD-KL12]
MNSLVVGIAITLSAFIALLWRHHLQCLRHCEDMSSTEHLQVLTPRSSSADYKIPAALSIALIFICTTLYSHLGRFSEWDRAVVDESIDYLIAADINRNARRASEQPTNEIALLNLAQSYADGGLYSESVSTLDELLQLTGEDAGVLGMKASALYYRDGREMNLAVTLVLKRALAIDEYEYQSRLLLATHAYLHGDYEHAIEQWQLLLKSDSQSFNRESINNAILKAEQNISNRSVTTTE